MKRTNKQGNNRLLQWIRATGAKVTRELLPGSLRNLIERSHYRRLLSAFQMDKEPDLAMVQSLVSQGDVVVDVGANIGVYTKFLSSFVGPSGIVISIEPVPRTFDFLAANVRYLGLRNVVTIRAAISSEPGCVVMEVPRDERCIENHYLARIAVAGETSDEHGIAVTATTIDAVLDGRPGRVSLIKIDTEGHELPCIRGAMRTLTHFKPALLIEIGGDMDSDTSDGAELVRILKDLGYGVYIYHDNNLRPRQRGERAVNYFFLTGTCSKLQQLEDPLV